MHLSTEPRRGGDRAWGCTWGHPQCTDFELSGGWGIQCIPNPWQVFQSVVLFLRGPMQPLAPCFDLNSCLKFRHLLANNALGTYTGDALHGPWVMLLSSLVVILRSPLAAVRLQSGMPVSTWTDELFTHLFLEQELECPGQGHCRCLPPSSAGPGKSAEKDGEQKPYPIWSLSWGRVCKAGKCMSTPTQMNKSCPARWSPQRCSVPLLPRCHLGTFSPVARLGDDIE